MKMAFVDDLGLQLILIGLVALTLFYVGVRTFFRYRAGGSDKAANELKSSAPLIAIFGFIVLVLGIYGELAWPLFAGTAGVRYNILFYDPTMLFGMTLFAFALALAFNLRTQYVGLFAMASGAVTMYYGVHGYLLGMTNEPLSLLGLYLAFGLAGVMTFPMTLVIDRFMAARTAPTGTATRKEIGIAAGTVMVAAHAQRISNEAKYRLGLPTNLSFVLFLLFMVGAAIIAFTIGLSAIPKHLLSAP